VAVETFFFGNLKSCSFTVTTIPTPLRPSCTKLVFSERFFKIEKTVGKNHSKKTSLVQLGRRGVEVEAKAKVQPFFKFPKKLFIRVRHVY